MKKTTRLTLFTLSLALLSACGFHLRGSDGSLDIRHTIYLASASGTVHQHIEKTLTRKQSLSSLAEADIQLVLGEEFSERRSASTNNRARTVQYQLTLSVSYDIFDQTGKPLIEQSTAEISRYYTFDQNAITSADKEEQLLRKEMTRQLARRILQRVMFLSRNLALKEQQESNAPAPQLNDPAP